MKKEILEEINRMKVLGGILSEATNPSQIIASLVAKFARTSLDDTILTAFESLEKRGVITIDNAAKTLTKIDWIRLTDDELKLLFSAKPLRDALEDVVQMAGVDISSSAQRITFKGNFKRIVKAYDDAANSIISSGGSKVSPKSWKDRLDRLLKGKKTTTGTRYVPTPDDFLDIENLVIAANPEMSASKVSKIVNETRKILPAKSQEEFIGLADTIISNMSNKLGQPKDAIGKKLWRAMRNNPIATGLGLIVFFPTITAGLSSTALNQFEKFLREFSPKFSDMLNSMGVSDPRTNSSSFDNQGGYKTGGASQFNPTN